MKEEICSATMLLVGLGFFYRTILVYLIISSLGMDECQGVTISGMVKVEFCASSTKICLFTIILG